MSELKSVFDGWTKQCFGTYQEEDSGACCAEGYLILHVDDFKLRMGARERIANHLRKSYPISPRRHDDQSVITYANDVLQLTPAQFRAIDLESQKEEAAK